MDIQHQPIFDTAKIEKLYSEKENVTVKYVCTSATNKNATYAADVYYRATPHPEYGNYYFGLYKNPHATGNVIIVNADTIEALAFGMIEADGKYHYSQHRHDYKVINGKMIDGGRAYIRSGAHEVNVFKIQDGEFITSK